MKTCKKTKRNKTGVEVTLIKRHKSWDIETEEVILVSSFSSSLILILLPLGFAFSLLFFCVFTYSWLLRIKSSLLVVSRQGKGSILNFSSQCISSMLGTSQTYPKLHRRDQKLWEDLNGKSLKQFSFYIYSSLSLGICLLWTTLTH